MSILPNKFVMYKRQSILKVQQSSFRGARLASISHTMKPRRSQCSKLFHQSNAWNVPTHEMYEVNVWSCLNSWSLLFYMAYMNLLVIDVLGLLGQTCSLSCCVQHLTLGLKSSSFIPSSSYLPYHSGSGRSAETSEGQKWLCVAPHWCLVSKPRGTLTKASHSDLNETWCFWVYFNILSFHFDSYY